MTNVTTFNLRPSEFLLDRVLNPTRDATIGAARPADILEACGIIPDFFCAACIEISNGELALTLDGICEAMDEQYGFGGFGSYPWKGTVDAAGVYHAANGEDDPMAPLARFSFEGRAVCFVYDYGVTAICVDGQSRIARFD